MSLLKVTDIHKTHNDDQTLKGVSLNLEKGEILCLLGPSGCGKTTLLRIIAGLETPDQGQVIFDGVDMVRIQPHERRFSMMFQEFALFPHKNVFENVAFGLRMQKWSDNEIKEQTCQVLSLVGLEGMETRNVDELSGGERQRVALARSLAPQPRLLMLDEPMGSLDRALRERLIQDLRQILKQVNVTAIFVTHDQNEAFTVADRIAVFNTGFIEQLDHPEDLYRRPINQFVAGFLGFQNLLPGFIKGKYTVETEFGKLMLDEHLRKEGDKVKVLIRPEGIRMVEENERAAKDEVFIKAIVQDRRFQGANYQISVKTDNHSTLLFYLPIDITPPQPNQSINLILKTSTMVVIN